MVEITVQLALANAQVNVGTKTVQSLGEKNLNRLISIAILSRGESYVNPKSDAQVVFCLSSCYGVLSDFQESSDIG